MRPLALDLCCGLGGWTQGLIKAGFDVIGIDPEDFSQDFPGTFYRMTVQQLYSSLQSDQNAILEDRNVSLIVASPPCQEFSRHDQPWTKKRNPPPPNLEIWETCQSIARFLNAPIIIENVRGAQKFVGSAVWHCGPYYFWGDVPALMPSRTMKASKQFSWFGTGKHRGRDLGIYRTKESRTSQATAKRSKLPSEIGEHIGLIYSRTQ